MKTLPAQEIDQVVSSYQGHFALNTTLKQASDVNDWLLYMNTYTERLFFETAEHLALCYRKKKAHAKAILLYKRLLQINPYHEQLYLFIMESYLEYNNPNEAMCVYETCQKILRNELNTEPQEELSTLYQSICNRPPSPTITTAPHMLESGATSELSVRVVDIQSQVQYYGLQKLIEPMIEELHHAEAHDNIFQELLPLSCVYPPINRHSRSACIYSTDAGILYCFKILLKRFASLSEIRIEAKGLKKTDSTTRSLIDTLIKEQPLPSCLVFLPEFNS